MGRAQWELDNRDQAEPHFRAATRAYEGGAVEAIGRDDLFAFLARHYTASNMVLSAAGRVEHDQIVDLAEKHFGSVPRTPANAIVPTPLRYVGGDGRETRVLEQAYMIKIADMGTINALNQKKVEGFGTFYLPRFWNVGIK